MIEIITKYNRHKYKHQLDQMYRQRYEVFVDQLKWHLPQAKNGLEIDEFDTEDTIYLISRDDQGNVQGSKRLIPTLKPHLMSEVFPHLISGDVLRGPHIWESSRSCISPKCRDTGIIGELFLAMVEVGLLLSIEKITFVCNMKFYPTILHAGWGIAPLGVPQTDDNGEDHIAACLTINSISLQNMRRNYQVCQTMLNSFPIMKAA